MVLVLVRFGLPPFEKVDHLHVLFVFLLFVILIISRSRAGFGF